MVDMAHFSGLVAGKVFTGDFDPVAHAQVVTATTHKTLRGPRAGLILSTREFSESLDKGCPLTMGGPLPHIIAAKAVAFREAGLPEFRQYAAKIVENCQALAGACQKNGLEIVTGGTDNHLFLANAGAMGLTGRQAENCLHECNITLNRNALPFDPNGPWYTSGIRIGTAAVTTLGMGKPEMEELGEIIAGVLKKTRAASNSKDPAKISKSKYIIEEKARGEALARIETLLSRFPVYPELDLKFLKEAFVD